MSEILLALEAIAFLVFLYYYDKSIAKEREQLYDRIQAKDFTEYKNATEVTEPRTKEERVDTYVEL